VNIIFVLSDPSLISFHSFKNYTKTKHENNIDPPISEGNGRDPVGQDENFGYNLCELKMGFNQKNMEPKEPDLMKAREMF
jgi:hypothetical protein